MKKILSIVLALALVLCSISFCFGIDSESVANNAKINEMLSKGEYEEGKVVVLVDNNVSAPKKSSNGISLFSTESEISDILSRAEILFDLDKSNSAKNLLLSSNGSTEQEEDRSIVLVESGKYTTKELLKSLIDDPRVIAIEPDYICTVEDCELQSGEMMYEDEDGNFVKLDAATSGEDKKSEAASNLQTDVPDYTDYQWAMQHDGEDEDLYSMFYENPELGDDINLENWNTYKTSGAKEDYEQPQDNASGVVVICDTGIDYTHPDLKDVMYEIPEEIYSVIGGGKYGYNSLTSEYDEDDVWDDHYHGTHCAGIVASEWNGFGTSGVASGVKLVAVKVFNNTGSTTFSNIAKGMNYITELALQGVPVRSVNFSLGGGYYGTIMSKIVESWSNLGIVLCVAAGNSDEDIDDIPYSSTVLGLNDNVIIVGSSAMDGLRSSFSNYGDSVDLFAPGTAIVSTISTSTKTYNAYLDPNPLFRDNLDGSLGDYESDTYPGIFVTTNISDWHGIGSVNNEIGDVDSYCIEVKYSEIKDNYSEFQKLGGMYPMVTIMVPLDGLEAQGKTLADVKYVSLAINSNVHTLYSGMYLQTADGLTQGIIAGNGISTISLENLADGYTPYVDEYNNLWLYVAVNGPDIYNGVEGSIYIDGVTLGCENVNYGQLNGTSMATPAVAGATAVLYERYKNVIENLPVSERAAYLTSIVKSSVSESRNGDALDGYCKSGGFINLGIQNSASPVIDSAKYVNGLISISGSFFGSKKSGDSDGYVMVNGQKASVLAWSESLIVINKESSMVSGFYDIEVVATNGKSDHLYTPLNFNDGVLFENEINLPDEVAKSATSLITASDNEENIYVISDSDDEEDFYLNVYNVIDETWTELENPPIGVDFPVEGIELGQMVCASGKLILEASFLDADSNSSKGIMVYDIAENAWYTPEVVLPDGIPSDIEYAELIGLGDDAYLVGGVCAVARDGFAAYIVGRVGIDYSKGCNIFRLVFDKEENKISMEKAGLLKTADGKAFGGMFSVNHSCSYRNTGYVAIATTWDNPTQTLGITGWVQNLPNMRVENVLFKLSLNSKTNMVEVEDCSDIMPDIDLSEEDSLSMAMDDQVLMLSAVNEAVYIDEKACVGTTFKTDADATEAFADTGRKACLSYVMDPSSYMLRGKLYTMGRSYFIDEDVEETSFIRSMFVHVPTGLEPEEILNDIKEKIEDNVSRGVENITTLIDENKEASKEFASEVFENTKEFVEQAMEDGQQVHDDIEKVVDTVKVHVEEDIQDMKDDAAERREEFAEDMKDVGNKIISNTIIGVMEAMEDIQELKSTLEEKAPWLFKQQ